MNQLSLKTLLSLVVVVILIIAALTASDLGIGKLYASLGIILIAITFHHLSSPKMTNYDKK